MILKMHRIQLFVLFYMMSLSYSESALSFELNVKSDAVIYDLNKGTKTEVRSEEITTIIDKNPIWIESPGRIPVLLVPLNSEQGVIKIDSPTAAQVFRSEKELMIDKELSDVTMQLTEIHRLIGEKKLSVALQKSGELRARFPNVKFLDFIDASISFLMGDKDRAISSVNSGLKAHPDYQQGLELKSKLTGDKR